MVTHVCVFVPGTTGLSIRLLYGIAQKKNKMKKQIKDIWGYSIVDTDGNASMFICYYFFFICCYQRPYLNVHSNQPYNTVTGSFV